LVEFTTRPIDKFVTTLGELCRAVETLVRHIDTIAHTVHRLLVRSGENCQLTRLEIDTTDWRRDFCAKNVDRQLHTPQFGGIEHFEKRFHRDWLDNLCHNVSGSKSRLTH
jgi:hypothetical protein